MAAANKKYSSLQPRGKAGLAFNAANQDVNRVARKTTSPQSGLAVVQRHSAAAWPLSQAGNGARAAGPSPHCPLDPKGHEEKAPVERAGSSPSAPGRADSPASCLPAEPRVWKPWQRCLERGERRGLP